MKLRVWVAVGLLAALAAALRWEYLAGGRLNGIDAVGDRVWAVGQDGLFLSSDDNGAHWRIRTRFTNRTLLDVEFMDSERAFALAERMLYHTIDAGAQWESLPMSRALGRLAWLGGGAVMIDGDRHLLWSTDGGSSWGTRDTGAELYFFRDSLLGWKGAGSTVYPYISRTTDGGRSWQSAGRPHPAWPYTLNLIAYADSMYGACSALLQPGNPRYSPYYSWFYTTDGGATWIENGNTEPGVAADCDLAGRLNLLGDGVIRGLGGFAELDPGTNTTGTSARGTNMWVCGAGGHLWSSANGAPPWQVSRAGTGSEIRAIVFDDSLTGWATTEHAVIQTTDGGKSWVRSGLRSNEAYLLGRGFFGLSRPEPGVMYASLDLNQWERRDFVSIWVGPIRIYRTTDDGAEWDTAYHSDAGPTFLWGASRLHFADRDNGIHVGNLPGYSSVRTSDGGASWEAMQAIPSNGPFATPYGYSFFDASNGLVTDSTGHVWHTTDGGVTWQDTATGFNLTDVEMTDEANGWATSGQGLLHTTDGGWGWELVSGTPLDLKAIDFSGPVGVAVGAGCAILRTTDGGVTWARDTTDFTSTLLDVFVLDSTYCWAAGENGLVLGSGSWALPVAEGRPAGLSPCLDVRPNPSRGEAKLRVAGAVTGWRVIDVTGRVVIAGPAQKGEAELSIDLHDQPPGVYCIEAVTPDGVTRTKLVRTE